jgi:hypothetical protein
MESKQTNKQTKTVYFTSCYPIYYVSILAINSKECQKAGKNTV